VIDGLIQLENKQTISPLLETFIHKYSRTIHSPAFYTTKDFEPELFQLVEADFLKFIKPSFHLAEQLGNLYTGSVYAALISLLCSVPEDQLVCFSLSQQVEITKFLNSHIRR
jgi:3-hydroxy-3-methylglutaryl CoA synthase